MPTGEYLKRQRMEHRLSLAAVAKAICLDEKLLRDIEQERITHVAQVYRNGYIRTYARYLQIPEDEIQNLISSPGNTAPVVQNIFSIPPKRNLAEKWLRATSYVLASLLIGTLAWQFTHEAVRLSQDGSRLQSGDESVQDPVSMTELSQPKAYGGTVKASIAPLGALHDSTPVGLDTAEQAWAAVSRPSLPAGESRLQISVSADSWVEITDTNGQQLEMDLLRGGSDKAYHGEPPFRILIGRASAVHLSVDGEPVDLAVHSRDEVAQLIWPQPSQAGKKGLDDKQ